MPRHSSAVPRYCLHKPTGQAYVRVRGKFHYLGPFGSPESNAAYQAIVENLARDAYRELVGEAVNAAPPSMLTVVELAAAYLDFADGYYRKNGRPTDHGRFVRRVMELVTDQYDELPVVRFGPLVFQELQGKLIERRLSRNTINSTCGVIRRMFRWGVSQEKVPETVYRALATVGGLKRGRTAARDRSPVLPVSDQDIDVTLPYLPPIVADMVRFQRLTGCRPGEVCAVRPCDVDRSGEVWEYRPESHKTEHHGRERIVFIGPQAQAVLLPYIAPGYTFPCLPLPSAVLRDAEAHCFSPAESEQKRRVEQRTRRKTRVQPSQRKRRKARPKRAPSTRYSKDSYRRAIAKAIRKANRAIEKEAAREGIEPRLIQSWHPSQLRHSAATEIRKRFGLEAAQIVLGHSKADITQVYAERDFTLAAAVMEKIG